MIATYPNLTRSKTKRLTWKPHRGAQTRFLGCPAFEAFYGGAAGPGKTECLVMEALRQIDNPRYNAIIFRRTFAQLEGADGLIARSKRWYPALGGVYNESHHVWTFPSGAKIFFSYLERDAHLENYQGAQFTFIGFDELTHFTLRQYLYMFSRCRADVDSGLRCYIRATGNPGGPGHEWVKARFVKSGCTNKIRWYTRVDEVDTMVSRDHEDGKSRCFIPATYLDNPKLPKEYISNLKQMPRVERLQLMNGDWDVVESAGMFKREWFTKKYIDAAPTGLKLVRRWDLAATEPSSANPDPDWTVGALLGRDSIGNIYILDLRRIRATAGAVEKLIRDTANEDGISVPIRIEQEGGASGKSLISHYQRQVLQGFQFQGVPTTGSKEDRAKTLAGQAETGNVFVVRAMWNAVMVEEFAVFPSGNHDDQVDAVVGAFLDLTLGITESAVVAVAAGLYGDNHE